MPRVNVNYSREFGKSVPRGKQVRRGLRAGVGASQVENMTKTKSQRRGHQAKKVCQPFCTEEEDSSQEFQGMPGSGTRKSLVISKQARGKLRSRF
jgi:hypothetical protein